jgi:hypothetical protein
MQSEDANELLKVIVEQSVVHSCIDVIKIVSDDGMSSKELQFYACCRFQGFEMYPQTAKISYDEPTQFLRNNIKPGQAILGVAFERDSVVKHRGKKGFEKHASKPIRWLRIMIIGGKN